MLNHKRSHVAYSSIYKYYSVPFCPTWYHTVSSGFNRPHSAPYGLINRCCAAQFGPARLLLWFLKSPSGLINTIRFHLASLVPYLCTLRFYSAHTVPYGTILSHTQRYHLVSFGFIHSHTVPSDSIRSLTVCIWLHAIPYDLI